MQVKRTEGFFPGWNQDPLYFQTWSLHPAPRGLLVITHGQGEHSGSYERLVRGLGHLPLRFLSWDLRGHGRSSGQRGFVENFSDYLRDFVSFRREVIFKSDLPRTLYLGHSMGGLIQLKTLVTEEEGLDCPQILSAPFFRVALQIPLYKRQGAQLINWILPKMTLHNEISSQQLTRDLDVIEEYNRDPLRHHKISAEAFLGASQAGREAQAQAALWRGPIGLFAPEQDPVVSTDASLRFFQNLKMKQKTCELFPDRRHEIFNDLDREEVFLKVADWIEKSFLPRVP